MVITAYLDMSESLLAQVGDDTEFREMVETRIGGDPVVWRAVWRNADGDHREGFVSAEWESDAEAIVNAHEHGFGREVADLSLEEWGSKEDLGNWMRSRCSS